MYTLLFNYYSCAPIISMHLMVTCGHPFQDRTSSDNDSIIVIGCTDPAMQGTTLSFVCPSYYVLVGPNTTTCIGNGEWEPDPKEVECRGMYCTNSLIAKDSGGVLLIVL